MCIRDRISIAAVFCPSSRSEFIELARYTGVSAVTSLIRRMQPSKSVSWIDSTKAPLAMGCTSCARDILSAGRKTMHGITAAAQYAALAARRLAGPRGGSRGSEGALGVLAKPSESDVLLVVKRHFRLFD